jgi:hypothetical protein
LTHSYIPVFLQYINGIAVITVIGPILAYYFKSWWPIVAAMAGAVLWNTGWLLALGEG